VVAQLFAGASYAVARWNRYALLLIAFLVQLLETASTARLARVRNQHAARTGFS